MKKLFPVLILSLLSTIASGQNIDLTFTAIDSAAYVQLDSIKVMNRTQGGDTTLYWPDTVLTLNIIGLYEKPSEQNAFQIFQNYPNPFKYQTNISLYVPEKDKVCIFVTDILGHVILQSERVLDKGNHSFRFIPGDGNPCFFSATWQGECSSICILQINSISNNTASLEYIEYERLSSSLKTSSNIQSFFYSIGDQLLFIGYFGSQQSGILDALESNETHTFQFATNIPCPGISTVTYEGQVYNTIQIFSQCWLKENLNVGDMIPGTTEQSNNGTIEKYCYNNNINNCNTYGGLYQWNEMMQYTTKQGTQGICPPGWHLPTDEEWQVLEGAVDSQFGIGDPEWDLSDWCGFDAGKCLKTTTGWGTNTGTDIVGFAALPGGCRLTDGLFDYMYYWGHWWSATEFSSMNVWFYTLYCGNDKINRYNNSKDFGNSVRCIKN